MSKTAVMGARALAFLASEASGGRSRAYGTIASGAGLLQAGTVLGEVTASGKYVAAPAAEVAGLEGAEVARAVLAYTVDASEGDVEAALIDRDAVVKPSFLVFEATVDDAAKRAAKLDQLDAQSRIRAR